MSELPDIAGRLPLDERSGLEDRVAALKQEILARTAELERSEAERRRLETELLSSERARRELSERVEAAEIEASRAAELKRRLDDVVTSTSWRWTAPFRRVVRMARRKTEKERGST